MLLNYKSWSQQNLQLGTLPAINFNLDLDKGYKLNFKWESRQEFEKDNNLERPKVDFTLSDFSTILTKKVGLNSIFAGGYLLRTEDGKIIHRTIQQLTFARSYSTFRMAQRLASDQTFGAQEAFSLRFRYRITGELPLSGQDVNSKEFYIKMNNEYLNVFEESTYDLEIRLTSALGYLFTDNNKVELGMDYRIDSFINESPIQNLWMVVNWYIKL